MLRRAATVCAQRVRFPLAATPVSSLGQLRWATTPASSEGAPATTAASGANPRNRASSAQRRRGRRDSLWPAFDLVHWNDENTAAGYLLRVAHRDGFISLDYHRQSGPSVLVDEDGSRRSNLNRAERVVTVTLPPVYVARFLSVLEGRADKVVVQSRFTNANFAPNPAKGPHCYSLQCTSMKPTSGQIQTADGADVEEETIEWSAELDAAESLMLHRFLSQSLHYNTGFCRTV